MNRVAGKLGPGFWLVALLAVIVWGIALAVRGSYAYHPAPDNGEFVQLSGNYYVWQTASETAEVDITDGLINFWDPGGELDSDDHAGNLDGTPQGGLTETTNGWEMGTTVGKYVDCASQVTNGLSYTVMAWCYPDRGNMDVNVYGGWVLSDRGQSTGRDFQLFYDKATTAWSGSVHNGTDWQIATHTNVLDETWQHVAVVVDGTAQTITVYVNGSSDGSTAKTGTASDSSTTGFRIGQGSWWTNSDTKFHGAIDKVRIYSEVKSQAFIEAVYDEENKDGH